MSIEYYPSIIGIPKSVKISECEYNGIKLKIKSAMTTFDNISYFDTYMFNANDKTNKYAEICKIEIDEGDNFEDSIASKIKNYINGKKVNIMFNEIYKVINESKPTWILFFIIKPTK